MTAHCTWDKHCAWDKLIRNDHCGSIRKGAPRLEGRMTVYSDNSNALYDATDTLLSTAREYGHGNTRGGDVVAAAYRLAAAKLRENGSDSHAKDLERAADQAEKFSR